VAGRRVGIGIVGAGNISDNYLRTLRAHPSTSVVGIADADASRARAVAAEFDLPAFATVAELLAAPTLELVVNITPPAAHFAVATAVLRAGKSVYNEKPLAITVDEGRQLLALARRRRLGVGGAPDSFLGPAFQAARRALDEGRIGRPIGAAAATTRPGPEHWHPNPAFFYAPGGGPLFDLGVYYLTTLVTLLGPIRRVSASARIMARRRPITGGPRKGETMTVRVPTHISAIIEFRSGLDATFLCSFDIAASDMPHIELFGTDGTLTLPDPTYFAEPPARIRLRGQKEWRTVKEQTPRHERGIGAADMAEAMRDGRQPRADGTLAFHVLEAMTAIHAAARAGSAVTVRSRADRPEPLPPGRNR
jgi:predicted dehydrogenase